MAQTTRATSELEILYRIADQLNGATDIRPALERTLEIVTKVLRLKAGWVWLIDPETRRFYSAASHNLPPYLREPVRMAGNWCLCTELVREGKLSAQNVNLIECSRLAPAIERKLTDLTHGFRYHASVPLEFGGKALGVMNLTGPKWRRLTRGELRLLASIALQIGATVERTRLADAGARIARVEERAWLAREIHDTLAQRLTAIALQLEGAIKHLDASGPGGRAREDVERALGVARGGIEEARRSVLSLRGAPVANRPLPQALEALGRSFTSSTGIPVSIASIPLDLPADTENELLAVANEALNNVAKHARATHVNIGLGRRGKNVALTVKDNGRGYNPRTASRDGHGMVGMRERAALVGASFSVASARGEGTTITVVLRSNKHAR